MSEKNEMLKSAAKLSRTRPMQAVVEIEDLLQREEIASDCHAAGLLEYELGNAWFILAESEKSLSHLSRACSLLKEANDLEAFSHAESLIGITFMNQGNMGNAMQIFSEESERARKNHEPLPLYKAECILGQCFFYSGIYEKAIDCFQRADKILKDNPLFYQLTESIPIAQAVMVLAQSEMHQFEAAEKTLSEMKNTLNRGSRFANGPFAVIPECYLRCKEKKPNAETFISKAVKVCLTSRQTSGDCLMILSQFELLLAEMQAWKFLSPLIDMMETILQGKDYYKVIMNNAWAKCRMMHACGKEEEAYKAMHAYSAASGSAQQAAVNFGLMYVELRRNLESISEENEMLRVESLTDELTGLANRRGMNHILYGCFETAQKEKRSLAVGIMDVDLFKQINDRYGHQEGDRCLKCLAGVLCSLENERLHAARYGGDEFVLIGMDWRQEDLKHLAKEIQKRIAAEGKKAGCRAFTVSQGYFCKVSERLDTEWNFLAEADQALYQAKRQHNGQVFVRN